MRTALLVIVSCLVWCTPLACLAEGRPEARTTRGLTVTLDVKDADVRDVLKSMQTQCGIKNMVIDPDVRGGGATLKFRQVPCRTAFRIVLRQFGLAGDPDPTVMVVEPKPR